jgi:tetratricopeptide (TPR) repeat protein
MSTIPDFAQQALEHARRGNFHEALSLAQRALAHRSGDLGLTLFVGLLHSRRLELDKAIPHFRTAMRLAPRDPVPRLELARVLIALNQLGEAEKLLRSSGLPGLEAKRLEALILIRRAKQSEAAKLYEEVVADDPRDFESWGNLGVCRLSIGDPKGAIDALTKSLRLRRDQQRFREKWAEAEVAAGTGEEGLALCHAFAEEHPTDPLVRVTIARLHDLLERPEEALESLEEALRIDPDHAPALVALASLHERQNRLQEFAQAIARLDELDPALAELALLKARLAYREGDFRRALELAREAPEVADPGSRAQLMGQISDRIGDAAAAFEAFTEMNRDSGIAPNVATARSEAYRRLVARRMNLATRKWVRSWKRVSQPTDQRDPIFLVGFPRSGTTLLDTLLMGHPALRVAEEKPMLESVIRSIGGYARIPQLDEAELSTLRNLYFAEAAAHVPDLGDRLLVDKQPFAMIETPLIHRLFPNARILFTQRHPCDVVLSCFITRFAPQGGLTNFLTLKGGARLYDETMRFWQQCRTILPLIVHSVRYERLVEDAESEMRALLAFLGLDWKESVLDSHSTAKERRFINTPSYSQVVEPVYDRSVGRWIRYRREMRSVLPILGPWAKQMGYEL